MDARQNCKDCSRPTANAARRCTACLDASTPRPLHRIRLRFKALAKDVTAWKREYRIAEGA